VGAASTATSQNWQILAFLGILLPQFQQRMFGLLGLNAGVFNVHPKTAKVPPES
jgi:hypothetical protein